MAGPWLGVLWAVGVLAPLEPGFAATLTAAERACVSALVRAGADVAAAQAALTNTCLDPRSNVAPLDIAPCVANDAAPRLADAVAGTFDAAVASCAEIPAFGVSPTVDDAVTTAAVFHVRGLFDDAFVSSGTSPVVFDASDRQRR